MKRYALILAGTALLWSPGGLHARPTGSDAAAKADSSVSQKDEYQKQVEAKLHVLERRIADLKAQAPREKRELRKQFNRQMTELEKRQAAAQRELEKFKNTSQQAWQDAKPGVDAALKDLETAYQRAAADFKD